MNNTQQASTRLLHIDGIKGLLCYLIMLGHFWNLCRWCNPDGPLVNRVTTFINGSILGETLFSATFWMYAFLVISGYLVSGSKVRTVKELIIKSINRYMRFYILIFGACVFIFVISKTIGFHTGDTAEFFTNAWFQNYYRGEYGLMALATEPINALFNGSCGFNDPFWVMSDIILASIIIYFCKYMEKFTDKLHWVCLLSAVMLDRQVIMACLTGYIIGKYRDKIAKTLPKVLGVLILLFVGLFFLRRYGIMPTMFDEYPLFTVFYCILLILVERLEFLKKFFGNKIFQIMGMLSFGVYSFHWPVICSVGSLVLSAGLSAGMNGDVVYVLSFVVSFLTTTILALIYRFTVEKLANKLNFSIK